MIKNKQPIFAVEAKLSDKSLSKHINYFSERTEIPKFYQVHTGEGSRNINDRFALMSYLDFSNFLDSTIKR